MENYPEARNAGQQGFTKRQHSLLPRPTTDPQLSRIVPPLKMMNENRVPQSSTLGLTGMLRTSTETGDIGIFSIRSSRVPNSARTTRRVASSNDLRYRNSRPAFEPYGVPMLDDRRFLPSYARDPTSEIISLYEHDSESDGRRYRPSDRCSSMTHTSSQQSYQPILCSRRSFASLRSQGTNTSGARRPKSPFAYPSRLRRPGYGPLSPAATDGDMMDYTQREELMRAPRVNLYQGIKTDQRLTNQSTKSLSPAYHDRPHQRQVRAELLRAEGTKFMPCFSSEACLIRRHASPRISNDKDFNSGRQSGYVSIASSPAKSIRTLSSVRNLQVVESIGKRQNHSSPTAPTFYDYTEEFDVNDSIGLEHANQSPLFKLDRTIPEDRPLSVESANFALELLPASPYDVDDYVRLFDDPIAEETSLETAIIPVEISKASTPRSFALAYDDTSVGVNDPSIPLGTLQILPFRTSMSSQSAANAPGSSQVQLTDEIHQVIALEATPRQLVVSEAHQKAIQIIGAENTTDSSSAYDESDCVHLSEFPMPPQQFSPDSTPRNLPHSQVDLCLEIQSTPRLHRKNKQASVVPSSSDGLGMTFPIRSGTTNRRSHGSRIYSLDPSLMDLADLVRRFEAANSKHNHLMELGQLEHDLDSKTYPADNLLGSPHLGRPRSAQIDDCLGYVELVAGMEEEKIEHNHTHMHSEHLMPRPEPFLKQDDAGEAATEPQIPRRISTRSGSPMFAPKPISPVRPSVPQLMKALPPLPIEYAASSTWQLEPVTDSRHFMRQATVMVTDSAVTYPRLKLRSKGSKSQHKLTHSRPWNSDDDYPWASDEQELEAPTTSVHLNMNTGRHTKLKLRVNRESCASTDTEGTVRINRNPGTELSSTLQPPREAVDLFTPGLCFENIIRHISKNFQPRKLSFNTVSTSGQSFDPHLSHLEARISSEVRANCTNLKPEARLITTAPSVFEFQSFFSEASSTHKRQQRLRKRISNLRARMVTTHAGRPRPARSYDDLTWRSRKVPLVNVAPHTARSFPDLRSPILRMDAREEATDERKHHQAKLRSKLADWLRGARSAFKTRFKGRHAFMERSRTKKTKQ